MSLTDSGKQRALRGLLTGVTWIALYEASGGAAGSELDGHGYARGRVAGDAWVFSGGEARLAATHVFRATDTAAQTPAYVSLCDADAGGNQLIVPVLLSGSGQPGAGQAFLVSLTLQA